MTLIPADQFEADIQQAEVDCGLFHDVIHGQVSGPTSSIVLEGGTARSLLYILAGLSGLKRYATKAALDADLSPPPNFLAFVTNDPTSSNNFMWYKIGASGTGSWAISDQSYLQSVLDSSPALDVERVKPSGFSYVEGRILGCNAPGRAIHDIDLLVDWDKNYRLLTGTPDLGEIQPWPNGSSVYVGPNGSDANPGTRDRPFATVKFAYQTSSRTVWLLPGDYSELLDLEVSDRTVGGGDPRAMQIRAVVPGTARFVGNNTYARDMTWVVTTSTIAGSVQKFNKATPTNVGGGGLGSVNAIVRRLYDENGEPIYDYYTTGGVIHKVHRFLIIPSYDLAGTLTTVAESFGWSQNSGTKEITIRLDNEDLNDIKDQIDIIYYEPAGSHSIKGVKLFMGGVVFYGSASVVVDDDGSHGTELYMQDCQFILSLMGAAFVFHGTTCLMQRTLALFSAADNLSYSGNSVGDGISRAMEIDCVSLYAGFVWNPAGLPTTVTQQPSTTHLTTYMCRINGLYGKGYGQSIADTGGTSKSWMVGTVCLNPYYVYDGATVTLYNSLYLGIDPGSGFIGWIDNVQVGGRGSGYGLHVDGATIKAFHSFYTGATGSITGTTGTVTAYVPASP